MPGKKIKDFAGISAKERNLIKGALRRVFSRSDLRKSALDLTVVPGYKDPARPRVSKWSRCAECKSMTPSYLLDMDHRTPIVPLDIPLDEMTLEELVERMWCSIENLQGLCETCHNFKSGSETKERAKHRKIRKAAEKELANKLKVK